MFPKLSLEVEIEISPYVWLNRAKHSFPSSSHISCCLSKCIKTSPKDCSLPPALMWLPAISHQNKTVPPFTHCVQGKHVAGPRARDSLSLLPGLLPLGSKPGSTLLVTIGSSHCLLFLEPCARIHRDVAEFYQVLYQ